MQTSQQKKLTIFFCQDKQLSGLWILDCLHLTLVVSVKTFLQSKYLRSQFTATLVDQKKPVICIDTVFSKILFYVAVL